MTSDEMSSAVQVFFLEANQLQWNKNKDYHPERIAFLEILRTAAETGISVEQDLWAKIRKQYVALRSFVIDGNVASESSRSRMIDLAVYMGMFAFWEEHKKRIVKDALTYIEECTTCERVDSLQCKSVNSLRVICDRCRFKFWLEDHVA